MAVQILKQNYAEEVKTIKNAISVSRYRAAKQANTAQLGLYYSVGGYISQHTRNAKWGTGALNAISQQLQQEIPGLKGFSEGNMRKMRLFYEAWQSVFEKRSQVANEIEIALVPDKLVPFDFAKCSQPAHELPEDFINRFLEVGFDSHMRILANVQSEEEKIFYVERCGREFWGGERLKLALQEDLYHQQGTMPNNFAVTLTDEQQRTVAMQTFKENNVLEFLPEENPSIGIVLCRNKDNTEVEFALRDISKPMGVATYRSRDELPRNYRYLPSSEDLKKLL